MPDFLLTKQDLACRWQVCERTVRRLVVRLGLPRVVLSRRTVRFRLVDVLMAEPALSRPVHIQGAGAVAQANHGRRAETASAARRAQSAFAGTAGTHSATQSRDAGRAGSAATASRQDRR